VQRRLQNHKLISSVSLVQLRTCLVFSRLWWPQEEMKRRTFWLWATIQQQTLNNL